MKIQSNLKITLALTAGLLSTGLHAAADTSPGAGDSNTGKSSDDTYSTQSAGVAFLQNITIAHGGGLIQWDPGPKIDFSEGHNITQNIAAGLQYGFAYNAMSKVDGQSVSSGDLWTVPVMLNGFYKYAFNDHWRVYGGLGGGGIISVLGTAGSQGHTYTSGDFGYEAMLGVKYRIKDNCELGLGYGFLGSLDNHFNAITTSPIYMHSIMLSFTGKW